VISLAENRLILKAALAAFFGFADLQHFRETYVGI